MIKYSFMDLDGTLFYRTSKISHASFKALKLLKKNNIDLIVATGRDYLGIRPLMKKLNSRYYILNNGALIYDYYEKKNIFESFFDNQKFFKYIERLWNNDDFILVYTSKGIYTNKYNFIVRYLTRKHFYSVKKLTDLKEILNFQIYKFYVSPNAIKYISHKKIISEVSKKYLVVKVPGGININVKNISKGTAIAFLQKKLKINFAKKSCHFGDGHNDLSVIDNVKYFIAMKHSPEAVKNAATYIVDSNKKNQIYIGVNNILKEIYK